ncbi:SrfA family protein [Methylolobus aquaticus]
MTRRAVHPGAIVADEGFQEANMAGALLRSGNVKQYKPLGATGNPVYRAASQLRAAIRRQLGADFAELFAIPQQDDKGDTIDWYAPREGSVVPWTAATTAEREDAKACLLAAQRELSAKSRLLQDADNSEQQVFGRLLELATRIPGEDHVYLVDGRPVMTFWGFVERDAPDYQDVLAMLDVGGDAANAAVGAETAETVVDDAEHSTSRFRWWRWPWWLLLLLGLLLLSALLFGLRGCIPAWVPGAELIAPVADKPAVLPDEAAEPAPEQPDGAELPVDTAPDETVIDEIHRSGVIDRSMTGSTVVDRTGEATESERTEGEAEQDGAEAVTPGGDEPAPPQTPAEKGAEPPNSEQPGEAQKPAEEPPGDPAGKQDTPANDKSAKETSPKVPGPGGAGGPDGAAGAPLTIPKDAAKTGSTDFMNGRWQSVTGLQDADGNPVRLEYEFAKGQGTARLRHRAGGKEQECSAAVRSSFRGSKLMIEQADDIRCPDGTRFQRSAVECATNPQGRAECQGRNQDGSAYQVRINKQ